MYFPHLVTCLHQDCSIVHSNLQTKLIPSIVYSIYTALHLDVCSTGIKHCVWGANVYSSFQQIHFTEAFCSTRSSHWTKLYTSLPLSSFEHFQWYPTWCSDLFLQTCPGPQKIKHWRILCQICIQWRADNLTTTWLDVAVLNVLFNGSISNWPGCWISLTCISINLLFFTPN